MTAPALVALAHGSRDKRSAATIKALVAEIRQMRPDLRIEYAFLDHARPTLDTAVARLSKAGVEEIVVVPLLLSDAYHAKVDVPEAVKAVAEAHPGVQIQGLSHPRSGVGLPRGPRPSHARGAEGSARA